MIRSEFDACFQNLMDHWGKKLPIVQMDCYFDLVKHHPAKILKDTVYELVRSQSIFPPGSKLYEACSKQRRNATTTIYEDEQVCTSGNTIKCDDGLVDPSDGEDRLAPMHRCTCPLGQMLSPDIAIYSPPEIPVHHTDVYQK